MSPEDDDRALEHVGKSGDSSEEADALTQELKRIDAESEAVEVEFEASAESEASVESEGSDDSDGRAGGGDDEQPPALIWAMPGMARLAVKVWLRSLVWGARTSVRATLRVGHAAVDPRATVSLARDVSAGVRVYAREFLGISELEYRVEQVDPGGLASGGSGRSGGSGGSGGSRGSGAGRSGRGSGSASRRGPGLASSGRRALARAREGDDGPPSPEISLRIKGAQLLRESADVTADQRTHPAYARILGELAPDEGRILRMLASEGPQPTVDVRALNLIGVGSQLVEQNLNMIGAESGCRHVERVPEYLINLQRLGLVEFADEALGNPTRYQVLEAQPEVLQAIKATTRAKTIHRALRLTTFGQKFCDVCLPLDRDEVEELTDDD